MKLVNRVADRLVASLVPRLTASAAPGVCNSWSYCYCSYGLAYRKQYICLGLNNGYMTPCQPAGAC